MEQKTEISITFITIATNGYLDLAHELARSMVGNLVYKGTPVALNFHILTNLSTRSIPTELQDQVQHFEFSNPPWPEITSERYTYLIRHEENIKTSHVFWVDADMLMKRSVSIEELCHETQISLAPHPGFTWRRSLGKVALQVGPRALAQLAYQLLRNLVLQKTFVLGDWETRRASNAFIGRKAKKIYYHGAIWGGPKLQVFDMCRVLSERTMSDTRRGMVARWHDESHLNWFAAKNPVFTLPDGFSGWECAIDFDPKITVFLSVDKLRLGMQRGSLNEDSL